MSIELTEEQIDKLEYSFYETYSIYHNILYSGCKNYLYKRNLFSRILRVFNSVLTKLLPKKEIELHYMITAEEIEDELTNYLDRARAVGQIMAITEYQQFNLFKDRYRFDRPTIELTRSEPSPHYMVAFKSNSME